jgi:hypothetical protein
MPEGFGVQWAEIRVQDTGFRILNDIRESINILSPE